MTKKDALKFLSPILVLGFVLFINYLGKIFDGMSVADKKKESISGVIDSFYKIRGGFAARVKTNKGYEDFALTSFIHVSLMNKAVNLGDSIKKDSNTLEIWIIKSNGTKTNYRSKMEE